MIQIEENIIVKGIREQDDTVLRNIYKEYFPAIRKFILKNSGQREDAEDIFQDGMIIIYKKVRSKDLILSSGFHTYLFAVCRNLWMQKLGQKTKDTDLIETIKDDDVLDEDIMKTLTFENEKYALYQKHFLRLSRDCQMVLSLFLKKVSLRDIAIKMGFRTEKYAKTKKYMCKETLQSSIMDDPSSNQFFYDKL